MINKITKARKETVNAKGKDGTSKYQTKISTYRKNRDASGKRQITRNKKTKIEILTHDFSTNRTSL